MLRWVRRPSFMYDSQGKTLSQDSFHRILQQQIDGEWQDIPTVEEYHYTENGEHKIKVGKAKEIRKFREKQRMDKKAKQIQSPDQDMPESESVPVPKRGKRRTIVIPQELQ